MVQPARVVESAAAQTLTADGIRPRNRRIGARSESGVANGWDEWMVTRQVQHDGADPVPCPGCSGGMAGRRRRCDGLA